MLSSPAPAQSSRPEHSTSAPGAHLRVLPVQVQRVLAEGLAPGRCGEVILRHGDSVGTVYTWDGKVAWVACGTIGARLRDLLQDTAGIDRDALNAVIAECRDTGGNFAETLLAWGLVDESTLRDCMVLHNATHLSGILQFGAGTTAIFVPKARTFSSGLVFTLEELLGRSGELFDRAKTTPPSAIEGERRFAAVVDQIPGCRAILAIDQTSGEVRAMWPTGALSAGETRGLGEVVSRLMGDVRLAGFEEQPRQPAGIREVVAMGDHGLMILRRANASVLVAVICEAARNPGMTLGMAHALLPELTQDWAVSVR